MWIEGYYIVSNKKYCIIMVKIIYHKGKFIGYMVLQKTQLENMLESMKTLLLNVNHHPDAKYRQFNFINMLKN